MEAPRTTRIDRDDRSPDGRCAGGGCVIKGGTELHYLREKNQHAFIDHHNGTQEMVISINFQSEGSDAVWVLPIPSTAGNISIDIVEGFPLIQGRDYIAEAKNEMTNAWNDFSRSYLLSLILPNPLFLMSGLKAGGMGGGMDDVVVHRHIENEGIIGEIISASDGDAVYDYLNDRNLTISQGVVPQLDDHIGNEFSFIVSWINGSQGDIKYPGFLIRFPCDTIFYPLLLTSVYEEAIVPVDLIVIGHVDPLAYDAIRPHITVRYFWDGSLMRPSVVSVCRDEEVYQFIQKIRPRWDGRFTAIHIEAPANRFVDDLWVEDEPIQALEEKGDHAETLFSMFQFHEDVDPRTMYHISARFVLKLTFLLSMIAAVLSGALFYKRKPTHFVLYAAFGLANFIGLCFLIGGLAIMKWRSSISWSRLVLFAGTIVGLYILSTRLALFLLTLPLM